MKLIKKGYTNTGFYRVTKNKDKRYHNGFYYKYKYITDYGGIRFITSPSIITLKNKIEDKGLEWRICNEELANKTIIESENIIFYKRPKNNTTGYYHVTMQKSKTTKQGFIYKYQYKTGKGYKAITSRTLKGLQKKVEDKGLLWLSFE